MIEVIMRGLTARKTRALLTAISVLLGVAMISGTFVLMDTVMSAYSQIFSPAYVHTDAVVTAQAPFGAIGAAKPAMPASLLTRIRALPQVQRAHSYIDAHAQLTDASGKPIGKAWAGAGGAQPGAAPALAEPGFLRGRPRAGEIGEELAEPSRRQSGEDTLAHGRAAPSLTTIKIVPRGRSRSLPGTDTPQSPATPQTSLSRTKS